MNGSIVTVGYRVFDSINLCLDCYDANHFRNADVTRHYKATAAFDYPNGLRCDYCHNLLIALAGAPEVEYTFTENLRQAAHRAIDTIFGAEE